MKQNFYSHLFFHFLQKFITSVFLLNIYFNSVLLLTGQNTVLDKNATSELCWLLLQDT